MKNGSVLSGIFHTINAEKDFGMYIPVGIHRRANWSSFY